MVHQTPQINLVLEMADDLGASLQLNVLVTKRHIRHYPPTYVPNGPPNAATWTCSIRVERASIASLTDRTFVGLGSTRAQAKHTAAQQIVDEYIAIWQDVWSVPNI